MTAPCALSRSAPSALESAVTGWCLDPAVLMYMEFVMTAILPLSTLLKPPAARGVPSAQAEEM